MTTGNQFERPILPPAFDDSRARNRRFSDDECGAVMRVIAERRAIRRFRPEPCGQVAVRAVHQVHRHLRSEVFHNPRARARAQKSYK